MKPFPLHVLPSPILEYVAEGSDALDCDVSYIGGLILPVLASAIGNTRRVQLKSTWTEPAVIWLGLVSDSGTAKSAALDLAVKPIWKRQAKLLRDYVASRKDYEVELESWKSTPKAERIGERPSPPSPCKHVIVNDITVESIADRLAATPRGTLAAHDELSGWFGSFNAYKSGGGSDVGHWLNMHGARVLKVDRKNLDRPTTYVPHAAVCVVGTIQPATLREVLAPAFYSNGLAARLLLCSPEPKAKRWTDHEISFDTMNRVDALFDQLFALQQIPGPEGDAPQHVELDGDAKLMWIDFVNDHNDAMQDMAGAVRAAWAKLEGYAARFALIRHCVRQATGEKEQLTVDESDIRAGIELSRWFGEETQRVYLASSETKEQREHRELVALIQKLGGTVSARDLRQHNRRRFATSEVAEMALQHLVDDADGCWEMPPRSANGRPRDRVFVFAAMPDDNFQSTESRRKPQTSNINGNSHFAASEAVKSRIL